ncbi:hypothetical protein CHGG_10957 [Chaetomium globosum CBS 148.51]|uniref:Uncharacterized protein n=1 Tax=Chaetomium globosum (strain ATCC 6205 / CBS 148.51 / DSM 1962 / NBRC 6347 / NRRL 1970) TaxID=306901 RepID=Q2GM47_CHAGB|nr:uncharacterized protein CHGG_10957 [Chaetomium globosum CBS 148.51]EAQ83139.1 hypothetical protein CHGG_10957 [Chaetomium globosum CBS 148.51]
MLTRLAARPAVRFTSAANPDAVRQRLSCTDYDDDACRAALRGEAVPWNLGNNVARCALVSGIRLHVELAQSAEVGELEKFSGQEIVGRARNARRIMSNRIPPAEAIEDEDRHPYCIWYPDLATEATYEHLAMSYPDLRYQIGRACAVAGYDQLYYKLNLLPDVSITEEARENRTNPGAQHIYQHIMAAPVRYRVMDDATLTIHLHTPPSLPSLPRRRHRRGHHPPHPPPRLRPHLPPGPALPQPHRRLERRRNTPAHHRTPPPDPRRRGPLLLPASLPTSPPSPKPSSPCTPRRRATSIATRACARARCCRLERGSRRGGCGLRRGGMARVMASRMVVGRVCVRACIAAGYQKVYEAIMNMEPAVLPDKLMMAEAKAAGDGGRYYRNDLTERAEALGLNVASLPLCEGYEHWMEAPSPWERERQLVCPPPRFLRDTEYELRNTGESEWDYGFFDGFDVTLESINCFISSEEAYRRAKLGLGT